MMKIAGFRTVFSLFQPSTEPPRVSSWLWMNGRLFFHATDALDRRRRPCAAWHERIAMLSPDLEVGWWCFAAALATWITFKNL